MLNILEHYIADSLPHGVSFSTNPNLTQKVNADGSFRPFYGNTVVFELDGEEKERLKEIQEILHRAAGSMLAERIRPETFHVTLHDLVNSKDLTADLAEKMGRAEEMARPILASWGDWPDMPMKATWVFNMVNTSLVLGLRPVEDENNSWGELSEMYAALNSVVPLGHKLTPHITLAYFRPGTYSREEVDVLRQALGPVNLDVILRIRNLVFQNFRSMNEYTQEPLQEARKLLNMEVLL